VRTSGTRVVAVAAVGATAFVARRHLVMRSAIADVAAELRSPLLPFVSVPYTARTLPFIRPALRLTMRPGRGVAVTKRQVAGEPAVRVLVTTLSERAAPQPALLWIHGGGMIMGSPQLEAPMTGRLARELGAVVVSPDYRLAPENPFPAGLDDCMATLRWMHAHADELGVDQDRIAVAGVSAGGGLAAAVVQRSCDEGITLRAQVLVYPMLDDRTALRDDHAGRGQIGWTPSSNRFAWSAYLGREPRMSEAPNYAAPARRTDLSGLPPAWIGIGGLDLFYEEDVAYADKLRACGVPCELITVPGMYHGADAIAPKAASMQGFRRGMLDHLRTYIGECSD
jgi:acetyl esterase/lipase